MEQLQQLDNDILKQVYQGACEELLVMKITPAKLKWRSVYANIEYLDNGKLNVDYIICHRLNLFKRLQMKYNKNSIQI